MTIPVDPDRIDPDRAFRAHDHAECARDGMARAESLARQRGLRMTPVRRRTLEIRLEDHRALGAYEVLERLAEDGFGRQPPVAYRALEFLVQNGLAHRIQRLNAFTACSHPGEAHQAAFLICRGCNSVSEAPATAPRRALEQTAQSLGFTVERASIEALGLCPQCAAP